MLRMAPVAVFLIAVAVFLTAALSSQCKSDEFPIYVFYDTYSLDTGKVNIDTSYSQMAELGVTHFYGWATPETAEKAAEYGLKIVAANEVCTGQASGSSSWRKNWFEISNLSSLMFEQAVRLSLRLDLEIEHQDFLKGYAFEIDDLVGQFFEEGEPPYVVKGYECLVNQHQEGYLFDGLAWGELHNEKSFFAEMTRDDDVVDCTAEFYMKIPTDVDDTLKVCRIEIWDTRAGNSLLAADTIYGSQFTDTDTFQIVQLDFPQMLIVGSDTTRIRLMPSLYWFDQVDLYIDRLRVFNPKGDTILIDTEEDTMLTRLEDYFDGLGGDISSLHSYYFPEPWGGDIPAYKTFTDLLKRASDPDSVPSLSDMGDWNLAKINNEVYTHIVDPPAVVPYDYWYRCGMNLATDTCINGWYYQPSDCWNIQFPLRRFIARLDSTYQKVRRLDPDKEVWMVLPSARHDYEADTLGNFYWALQDPTKEVFKVGVYLSLAHGAKGLGFWTYGTYDFPLGSSSQPSEPISYEEYMADYPDEREPEGEIPEECIHEGNLETNGLVDWDPDSSKFVLNEKWYLLKDILDRAKPLGSILRECELDEVGRIDDPPVGFVDSVIGEYDTNWIEAATFTHNTSDYDYFMLVNRRLLVDETNAVTVFLNEMGLLGTLDYYVIDQSTADTMLVNSGNNYSFLDTLQPGEGYLYEVVAAGLSGSLSGRYSATHPVVGDITVAENDTVTFDGATFNFSPVDFTHQGVDTTKPELIVEGTLIISDSTVLKASNNSMGSWYGIRVVDGGVAVIENSVIKHAYIGVEFESDEVENSITHSTMDSCLASGLSIHTDHVEVYGNVIRRCSEGYGISIWNADPIIDSNQVLSCKYAIYASRSAGTISDNYLYGGVIGFIEGPIPPPFPIFAEYGIYHTGFPADSITIEANTLRGTYTQSMILLDVKTKSKVLCNNMVSVYSQGGCQISCTAVTSRAFSSSRVHHNHIDSVYRCVDMIAGWIDIDCPNPLQGSCDAIGKGANTFFSFSWTDRVKHNRIDTLRARGNYWEHPDSLIFTSLVDYEPYHASYPGACGGTQLEKPAIAVTIEPIQTTLLQNFPNPFNPSTEISYSVSDPGLVRIDIYNILGQRVTTLVNGYQPAGHHSILWNGNNSSNDECASGIYFLKMTAGGQVQTKKMLILK